MKKYITISAMILGLTACQDFLDVPPQGVLLEDEALQTPEDYEQLLNSCYDVTANYFNGRMQIMNDLLSDNVAAPTNNQDFMEVYNYNTLFFNGTIGGIYGEPYIAIFRINAMLENLDKIELPASTRNRIEAEGRFLRALGHFELVKLWAQPFGYTPDNSHPGIVIKTSTSTALVSRNSVAEVYQQIIADLEYAEANLNTSNGNYATSWAAKALLAKVYFQMNDYQKAFDYADEVIEGGSFSLHTDVDRFGPISTAEAIFSTVSTNQDGVIDSRSGVFTSNYRSDNNPNPIIRASQSFYLEYSADTTDTRLAFFEVVNPDQPNEFIAVHKFDKDYFNVPVLHLTDMHLLRAEALLYLGSANVPAAVADVNLIIERARGAGSPALLDPGTATLTETLEAVRYERRIEMFGEGDRIQQLKRRGASGETITVRDGAPWNCPGMILQFPISELVEGFEMNETGGCL